MVILLLIFLFSFSFPTYIITKFKEEHSSIPQWEENFKLMTTVKNPKWKHIYITFYIDNFVYNMDVDVKFIAQDEFLE
jgi:hypothetical protein